MTILGRPIDNFVITHWRALLVILFAAVVLAALAFGCAPNSGGLNLPFRLGGGVEKTAGVDSTYDTLTRMSWFFAVPGVLMLAASYWIPPLKQIGGVLATAGVALAIIPWVLDTSHFAVQVAMWCIVAAGAAVLGAWAWNQVSLRIRKARVTEELKQANGNAVAKAKHGGALAAIERQLNPKVDKAFKRGDMTVEKLVAGVKA